MQATIAVLPVSLSLVHIPRRRLPQLAVHVLRQILRPNHTFLNITCNQIELSLFAESSVLCDFEPIARRDRRKLKARAASRMRPKTTPVEPVEICYETWSVLQIDSHSDQLDNSGARVHELSAPLAAAGISILYQSSYMSDFVLVREARLHEAMSLFASAGFHLYSIQPTIPLAPSDYPPSEIHHLPVDAPAKSSMANAVFTRSRSASHTSVSTSSFRVPLDTTISRSPTRSPTKRSLSPTSVEVLVLDSDLTCVGLSEEYGVDHWGLKIVKLVAFPELINYPTPHRPCFPRDPTSDDSFVHLRPTMFEPFTAHPLNGLHGRSPSSTSDSSSDDDDGYFSHSPQNTTASLTTSTTTCRSWSDFTTGLHPSPPRRLSRHPVESAARNIVTRMTSSLGEAGDPRLPFFSFTRTAEGSSLTADVVLLATLFPPSERHMVICRGELDAADKRLNGIETSDGEENAKGEEEQYGSLKCLQVDLRRFGLDKHGLVNRFSRVLEENGINHLYSSTFKTANLLVDKKHALRAQALLRSC